MSALAVVVTGGVAVLLVNPFGSAPLPTRVQGCPGQRGCDSRDHSGRG
jgi:hypothetical protein